MSDKDEFINTMKISDLKNFESELLNKKATELNDAKKKYISSVENAEALCKKSLDMNEKQKEDLLAQMKDNYVVAISDITNDINNKIEVLKANLASSLAMLEKEYTNKVVETESTASSEKAKIESNKSTQLKNVRVNYDTEVVKINNKYN
ncbi:MAG: hypothetical protein LBS95_01550 [Mycoplasmataceae bacterium]|jgi:hypothetical protein|nr:hypothetical protein [Mycoplasmataceae bacterium]